MSEELGGVEALFHHVRQELEGLALKVARAVLNIESDCVVPFQDGEDLRLEEEHVHIGVQNVHLFHLEERLPEQPAAEALARQSKDHQTNLLNCSSGLLPLSAVAELDEGLELGVAEVPKCCPILRCILCLAEFLQLL